MTQKEFEKRVKEENLRMKDFSLEIGVLMEAIDDRSEYGLKKYITVLEKYENS